MGFWTFYKKILIEYTVVPKFGIKYLFMVSPEIIMTIIYYR